MRLLVVAAMSAELPRNLAPLGATGMLVGMRARSLDDGPLPGDGPVLITGSCGALTTGHPPGTLVLADAVVDAAGALLPDVALHAEMARAAHRAGLAVAGGRIVQASEVIDSDAARADLARSAGAEFVDLESARLARACIAAGRPWAMLRVVTDAPGASLQWLGELLGGMPEGEVNGARVAWRLLRKPSMLPKVIAIGRLMASARADLREVVSRLREGTSG